MNFRKDKTVAKVGVYKAGYEEIDGLTLTLEIKEYPSINLAKKANGLNARTLKRGESFPPTVLEALNKVRNAA